VALVSLVRRNRRRYGGYIAHAGLAVLLIGVAGSSSFQHSRDVSLRPGQSAVVDGYTIRYVRPLAHASAAKLSFGAELAVYRHGHYVETLRTTRGFYPTGFDGTAGPISEAFNGSADSNVGLDAGLTHDIWTVVNPDLQPLQGAITRGDHVFERLMQSLTPAQARQASVLNVISAYRARAIVGLTHQYVTRPWPIEFLLIVSPLVSWIWLGAIVIALGGVIALWPPPGALLVRRRSTSMYAARLARELA
jgi:cytochrome c-type biogenesis protein CcmF